MIDWVPPRCRHLVPAPLSGRAHGAAGAWLGAHRRGRDTLIAAPTGSGKTLAGFLVAIDALYLAHEAGEPIAARHGSCTCRR